uniref:Uncharacterized protein n=1 Tax=Arthrobacter sp. J3.40 TaxID=347209 RepID=I3W137_9MICC|nr:hypothetical protein [Arthrobacter sp. J3.40]
MIERLEWWIATARSARNTGTNGTAEGLVDSWAGNFLRG